MKRTTCPGPPFRRTGAGCFISGRPPPPRTWPPETWPAGTWCTNPRKPLFLRFLCTKSQAIFWRGAGEDLVHESPQALASPFPLHQVSGHFRRGACEDLVHESPQALVPPFPLHQVSGHFLARGRRRLGARIAASPCFSFSFAPSLRPFSARGLRRLGARIAASPCFSFSFAPSLRSVSPRGRASWRPAPGEAFALRRTTPTSAPLTRKTWCLTTKE